ncbi:LacI family DNA-binding transcriptional regulator [Devosia honganensis]|uniref:LacI family DNA-binding transcriptional regulator n=1 Tax=Devosia honganensis TaxID=1610527 RepID=A0ABV7WZY2_9HYPH
MNETKKRATLAEVAALAGVSQSTVSLVLNAVPDSRIAAATRKKVLKSAEALGYRTGPMKRHVIGSNSVVGLVIDEMSSNWLAAALVDEIRDLCWEREADLLVSSTRGQPEIEEIAIKRLMLHAPVGMIYASLFPRLATPPTALLSSTNTVMVNCYERDGVLPATMPDFHDAAYSSMLHLFEAGHTRIGFLNHESWHIFAQRRNEGYKAALSKFGLSLDRNLVRHLNGSPDEGYRGASELLALARPPTAILCANDRMAFGAYDAVRNAGLKVGEDIALVGYDDHDLARYMHPPLTTIRNPYREMARWAVERLLTREEQTQPQAGPTLIPGELLKRGSSQAKPEI